jgi:hypothetical protein
MLSINETPILLPYLNPPIMETFPTLHEVDDVEVPELDIAKVARAPPGGANQLNGKPEFCGARRRPV